MSHKGCDKFTIFTCFLILKFLAELKLMDYSLLVGIHDCDRYEEEQKAAENNDENGEEEDSGSGGALTPPDSPGPIMRQHHLFSGEYEFDSSQDVYAIPCDESELYGAI